MDIYWDMFGDIERISMEFINDQQFNNHMGLVEDGGTMVDFSLFSWPSKSGEHDDSHVDMFKATNPVDVF